MHHFVAKAQSSFFSHQKDNLTPHQAIVLLDFVENYSFIVRDKVQGFHWNNAKATIHPFVIYYKTKLPFMKKLLYFNDGSAGQYKNYKNLTNLSRYENNHGLEAEWDGEMFGC
uniref:Uncharacterized protein n=1 Tax=Octopus bimaculoides TaxID=37653 RepID=A0A0L8HAT8_OCTBM